MRFVHTSDWHLGQELNSFDRGFEHDAVLEWLADQLEDLEADALLVAGDLYDSVNPPVPAQRRLYRFLSSTLQRLPELQIVIVGGNHDSASRIELPQALLEESRVFLVGGMPRDSGKIAPAKTLFELADKDGKPAALCAAVPYLRIGDLPPTDEGHNPVAALYEQVFDEADLVRDGKPLIATGHLNIAGGQVSEMSERRILIGGEESVPHDVFGDRANYVALGHLHRPQRIAGQDHIRYSGSLFPMSVSERDYDHGIVVVDCDQNDVTSIETRSIPRPVEFIRVPQVDALPPDELETALIELDLEDPGPDRRPYLEVSVRLSRPEPDLRARIDAALDGKPVRLTRIASTRHDLDGTVRDDDIQHAFLGDLDPKDVFRRKHEEAFGAGPEEDLMNAFQQVLADTLNPEEPHEGRAQK